VAEHGVLDHEGTLARPATGDQEPPAKQRVEEGEEHWRMERRCWSGGESGFPRPTGLRRDQEHRPALAWEGPGQGGKHGAVEGRNRGRPTWRRRTASW
jgi:hypothetical protein